MKPTPIPISAAAQIADSYGYEQVVIIGRRHSDNAIEHCTTYGVDKANCDVAARMGQVLQRAMGWPNAPSAEPQAGVVEVVKSVVARWRDRANTMREHCLSLSTPTVLHREASIIDSYADEIDAALAPATGEKA